MHDALSLFKNMARQVDAINLAEPPEWPTTVLGPSTPLSVITSLPVPEVQADPCYNKRRSAWSKLDDSWWDYIPNP
jgi:hypothetical protein